LPPWLRKGEQAKKVKTDKRKVEMKREHHQRNVDRKQRRTGKIRMLQIRDEGDGTECREGVGVSYMLRVEYHS
jgi:hypothetical protein